MSGQDNCIGQTVYFRLMAKSTEVLSGKLLDWSMCHIETEHGPGHYPVAVVRCHSNNQVVSVEADLVSFDRQSVFGEPGSLQAPKPSDEPKPFYQF